MEDLQAVCVICDEPTNSPKPTVKLTKKGCDGINFASASRKNSIHTYPGQYVHTACRRDYCNPKRISQDTKTIENSASRYVRSKISSFSFQNNCLFCGQLAKQNKRKRGYDVFPVRTLDFKHTILQLCSTRGDDWAHEVQGRLESVVDLPAADAVYHQTCNVNFRTLKNVPCSYSAECDTPSKQSRGRPKDQDTDAAFLTIVESLKKGDTAKVTIIDLVDKMKKLSGDKAFSVVYMKHKLEQHFGDEILITEINGKPNVVTLRSTASSIVHDFYSKSQSMSEEARKRELIKVAAKLIKLDVQSIKNDRTFYPSSVDIASTEVNLKFLPESLRQFLTIAIGETKSDIKICALGQAIMQACRPRTILAPLQLGLAVQLHHQFASRFLVEHLSSLGYCVSYTEVQKFESNAAVSNQAEIENYRPEMLLQYAADNVDHNVRTLDGHGTFHGMGMIACVTPGNKNRKVIPRKIVSTEDLLAAGQINITFYTPTERTKPAVSFAELEPLRAIDGTWKLSLITQLTWPLRVPGPEWSGFMQSVMEGNHPGQSTVTFLPMIDMNPTDMSCIYSTLIYISNHAQKYSQTPVVTFDQPLYWKAVQIISCEGENSSLKHIVLRLGGFHCIMSFLGCIGHLMSGSGLSELLETVYATNTVPHILSGKAVARAVRGHLLVDTALNVTILSKFFLPDIMTQHECSDIGEPNTTDIQLDRSSEREVGEACHIGDVGQTISAIDDSIHEEECFTAHETSITRRIVIKVKSESTDTDEPDVNGDADVTTDNMWKGNTTSSSIDNQTYVVAPELNMKTEFVKEQNNDTLDYSEVEELAGLYTRLLSKNITVESVDNNHLVDKISKLLVGKKQQLLEYPTSALWIQYMDMVKILRRFLTAERTGNWGLCLRSLYEMLPYFAAAGHSHYLKSAYFYIQSMQTLAESNQDVYEAFKSGHHVIRRSDRYWGGLSTDLVIEQALMRSVKTTGGLTHGRGVTEAQRTQWLLSMPSCVDINNSMQVFSKTEYQTSPQHKEQGKSRIERDHKDTKTLLKFISERNPFREDSLLCNIETGVTADPSVNAYDAKHVGTLVLNSMVGQNIFDYSFKRCHRVKTFDSLPSIKVDEEVVKVDPQLLFQRLSAAAQRFIDDIPNVFSYELCSVPSSLFDDTGLIRKSQKAILADAIWSVGDCSGCSIGCDASWVYVLDGGSLLHRIPWTKGAMFSQICLTYVRFVSAKYPEAIIVFDGYLSGTTIKDTTHVRRTHGISGTKVVLSDRTPFTTKKETFLANSENKQNFIFMLGKAFEENEFSVIYAEGDADVLISKTAVELAHTRNVTVIGEDTDLLVLLLYHSDIERQILFKSDVSRGTSKANRTWDISRTKKLLGIDICQIIPVIHALTGCDSTSQMFGVGKGSAFKKLRSDTHMRSKLDVFLSPGSTKDDIAVAGESILVHLHGGMQSEGLDQLRFRKFTNKVMSSSRCVQVQSLPPTSSAAKLHCFRAYYQVQEWIGDIVDSGLSPVGWGWENVDDRLTPLRTDRAAAPDDLLKMIRCRCKSNCDTKRCTCRRNGLECSYGCGECRGISCSNVLNIVEDDLGSDD